MKTVEELTAELQAAKRDMEKKKYLYYHGSQATYDEMAAAAKKVANLTYEWQKAKYPTRRPVRPPYQALLR
jgi:hypothetical protein